MYVSASCVCSVHGGQRGVSEPLELELQDTVSYPRWVLETKLWSSGKQPSFFSNEPSLQPSRKSKLVSTTHAASIFKQMATSLLYLFINIIIVSIWFLLLEVAVRGGFSLLSYSIYKDLHLCFPIILTFSSLDFRPLPIKFVLSELLTHLHTQENALINKNIGS